MLHIRTQYGKNQLKMTIMTLYGGEKYSSIMKMHSGLSALTLFWFQRSKKEDWNESYKLARKLKITSNTHIRMFIEILFDCSTPDPILSSSDVFYCVLYFLLLTSSSFSPPRPILIYTFAAGWVYISKRKSAIMRLCVYECAWIWPAFCYCHTVHVHVHTLVYQCTLISMQLSDFSNPKQWKFKFKWMLFVVEFMIRIYEPIFNSWYAFNT